MEFETIQQYFTRPAFSHPEIEQNIGDDCAVVKLEPQQRLAITTDTLVCGTHFLPDISPSDLAYKAVAVNLSDLAAMGATPRWLSLAITLPHIDHHWLRQFSESLFNLLDQHKIALIGGDTTKGELSLTLTAYGVLEQNKGLFRYKANIGDYIYVSGSLGDSAAGLDLLLSQAKITHHAQHYLITRHLRPTARVELGKFLTQYSDCAIDISDGLLADLGHILNRSQCGAQIFVDKLPLTTELLSVYSPQQAINMALTGGEDYELCFTISPQKQAAFQQAVTQLGIPCTCIGNICEEKLTLYQHGNIFPLPNQIGFNHFKS